MGTNSRYDRYRPVSDLEAAEASALRTLAEMLAQRPAPLTRLSGPVRGQIGQIFYATANELANGRGLPIGLRRAVRGLADAIRRELDPRNADEPSQSPPVHRP